MLGYPVLVWNRSNGFRIKRARRKGFVERKRICGVVELVNRLLGGLEVPFRAFWQKVHV